MAGGARLREAARCEGGESGTKGVERVGRFLFSFTGGGEEIFGEKRRERESVRIQILLGSTVKGLCVILSVKLYERYRSIHSIVKISQRLRN